MQNVVLVDYSLLLNHIEAVLDPGQSGKRADLSRMQVILDETQAYLDAIVPTGKDDASRVRMLDLVHTLDHLQRLHERCEEDEDRAITARETRELASMHGLLAHMVHEVIEDIGRENRENIVRHSQEAEQALSQQVDPLRDLIASRVADDSIDVPEATDCLEAIRWLHRVSHHVARINYHLENALLDTGK